ncbi:unnamed protein product [Diabrotica balteata]|uniref:Uncharacterized protein n=1 Tax=Diabrotica balteata TaxID=107213 RepID=A0A9N9SPQ6_DIABA|nr:unnamed protein product [Diabrotica balteata]
MKNGRSPGPGNISVEILKAGGPLLIEIITFLINQCCQQIKLPSEWKTAHQVSIFKKGNRNDPNYYKGLSVLPIGGRLFGKIINGKIQDNVGYLISEDQSGYIFQTRLEDLVLITCLYSNN